MAKSYWKERINPLDVYFPFSAMAKIIIHNNLPQHRDFIERIKAHLDAPHIPHPLTEEEFLTKHLKAVDTLQASKLNRL